ncbi:hypothetical protein H8B06_02440 [Sphingobacterium sp. DN00404]|uniref:Uncharacterized protein n=1 Tax=Sphingobacterium micropteri TaxID=2763501 RepID=A0ABR7YK17_9SPHI|nr:hypothetical protein [Sphingobacterium micropteri]MBD1431670.1 hypothetical protein [Sphingobacterium micropteri]
MYWYRNRNTYYKAVIATAVTALCLSCTPNPGDGNVTRETYFDIPDYFKTEIARLMQEKPVVDKTVVKDSLSETKEIQITDWENELSSFVSVDLNKPVYAGILTKDSTANKIKITSSDPKIDIALVEIEYSEHGEPTAFRIQRNIQNSLYETHETLHYAKGKGYSLEKQQSVLILGDKYYHIEGLFKHQTAPAKSPGP